MGKVCNHNYHYYHYYICYMYVGGSGIAEKSAEYPVARMYQSSSCTYFCYRLLGDCCDSAANPVLSIYLEYTDLDVVM